MPSFPSILYLCPSDPARTAITAYSRHFARALALAAGAPPVLALPPGLPENIDSAAARRAVRDAMRDLARSWRGKNPLVHVEIGNALHREFWAGYYLQQYLQEARFFATLHDPPKLTSNPYRYIATEWAGRTPFRMLDKVLTRLSEATVRILKARAELAFLLRCETLFTLTEAGAAALRNKPPLRNRRVQAIPHVYDFENSGESETPPGAPNEARAMSATQAADRTGATAPTASEAPEETPAAPQEITALLFCFLCPGKGVEELLEAFDILNSRARPEIPALNLRIAGGIAEGSRSETWVREIRARIARSPHASRIRFDPRFIADTERDRLLQSADILVLPYRTVPVLFSSAGTIEALAQGRATVVSRANTQPELIRDGENGLLYPEDSPAALADCLERLACAPALRQKLGDGARRTILDRHTPEKVAEHLARHFWGHPLV